MLALGALLLVPVLMWVGQSVLLRVAGLPLQLRLGAPDLPRSLRGLNRLVTNVAFVVALLGYPLVRGQSPWAYYVQFFPLGPAPRAALHGAAAAILYLALLYLAWMLTGNVHFRMRHAIGRLARRWAGVPLTAVLIALVEELLFRAMLLAGLLEAFGAWVALPAGTVIFAAAHYVRSVKRYWTFPGHVALGALLCAAFYWTGNVWLSFGVHAGGVLVLMAVRPVVRYTGPAWLVGASIFPYAGAVGIAALVLLTVNMWLVYGGVR